MKKATHSGHCQCCGSLQKLPKDVLSLHGYTVDFGFFAGVCRGAGHKPYELSCELIQRFVDEATQQLADVQAEQERLRAPATEAKAWVHEYHRSTGSRRSYYQWELKDVTAIVRNPDDDSRRYTDFVYTGETMRGTVGEVRIDVYDYTVSRAGVFAVCTMLNTKKADSMDREVRNLENYIAWQQKRITDWKLRKLFPVTQKDDKQGFKAEEGQ